MKRKHLDRIFWAAIFLLATICIGGSVAGAQQKPGVAGNYSGSLGPLRVELHLAVNPDGAVTGTLDSPNQGVKGLPCTDIRLDGDNLSFAVPAVGGTWKGTVAGDGATLTGTWSQGSPQPLNFKRDTFVAATKPSAVDGIWLGTMDAGGMPLRIQVKVKSDNTGNEFCTVDSLDMRAMGVQCEKAALKGNAFSFEVPRFFGNWNGTLSTDGNTLTGTWTSFRKTDPLVLRREEKALALPPLPPPAYDPAMPPVNADNMQAVLTRDLAGALKDGALAPATGGGVAIGIVAHGVSKIFIFGAAKPDAIFEIGSISKTFTGLIMSQMVLQKKVTFDEPVRELLPPGTVDKPAGPEITLYDLVTQHSGLPSLPDNFHPADVNDPYADYHATNLYAYLHKHGVANPAKGTFVYSNLGVGLLGQVLADRAGVSYPELLKQEVTGPLGLQDTVIHLSPDQQARFIQGHDAMHRPTHPWNLDALAGAGAIRSTAGDMLKYVEANLHPDQVKPVEGTEGAATLSAALVQSHVLHADSLPGMQIALIWLFQTKNGTYWHNGGTGGFSSYAFFNPKGDYAAVVLYNTTIGPTGSFADTLGEHIRARFAGEKAISLSPAK